LTNSGIVSDSENELELESENDILSIIPNVDPNPQVMGYGWNLKGIPGD